MYGRREGGGKKNLIFLLSLPTVDLPGGPCELLSSQNSVVSNSCHGSTASLGRKASYGTLCGNIYCVLLDWRHVSDENDFMRDDLYYEADNSSTDMQL